MSTTVNEPGSQYTWMAEGRQGNAFTPLSRPASEALDRVSEALRARLSAERQGKKFSLDTKLLLDCVHKLEALAYHLTRIRAHKATLLQEIRRRDAEIPPKSVAAFSEPETVFEFEALVLQARATLDATTWLLSRACGQKTWKFSSLHNVLSNAPTSDNRMRQCLALLNRCQWMSSSKVLMGDPSTRSYVAHYGSLLTTQKTCFTINRLDSRRVLLFDMEMHDNVPVMATAAKIHEEVAFFVMAALSVLLDLSPPRKKAFASDLGREFVVISESLVSDGQGTKIGVIKEMGFNGFTVGDVSVSADILTKAVTLSNLGGPLDG